MIYGIYLQDHTHIYIYQWTHLQLGELREDGSESVMEVLLRVLHFGHIKAADAGDFELFVDNCWGLALCL